MALIDRVVEYPGRIKLTAVSGEADTYDVERSEGIVTAEGTPLNAAGLNTAFSPVYEEYTGTISYDAGTIGTRAVAVNLGSAEKTGYKLSSVVIIGATSASAYNAMVYVSNSNIYAAIHRATSASVSSASITVRAMWLPE